ncbi:MAG: DUF29 domain-containing protein [Pseudomonadota bacterium]
MDQAPVTATLSAAYDDDFLLWTQEQAASLRHARPNGFDWENIAEELESLGRADRREIKTNMRAVVLHVLKCAHQPEKHKGQWESSIIEHRRRAVDLQMESPSLKPFLAAEFSAIYDTARERAAAEMGKPIDTMPRHSAYSLETLLTPGWLPGPANAEDDDT